MPGLFDVSGKVALVTGGRRGLGRAMVRGLAQAGARVAVVARSSDPGDLPSMFEDDAQRFVYLQADLADRAQRQGLVARAVEKFGRLDIMVNNAGIQGRSPVMEYPQAQWDLDIELLLTAVFELSRQAAEIMVPQGGGKIIQLASISSFQGARGIVGYATAKHALVGLVKCLANELAPRNINVNAIAPGLFDTEMAAHVVRDPEKSAELKGRIPSGRFGRPEDVVGPLIFLASDASQHVHGHVLLVDGGWMGR